ncbi:MAG: type II toxin-antitoxin system RelE/ParE family toxin, partial [Acidaminococcales bacterium]|nr:type II toxin-antitoxin system RelE/ParE family toxin [Acidaminococcales bacterium]
MIIKQSTQFEKTYKKLGKARIALLNQAIGVICANPAAGEKKSGSLKGLMVYKFKARKTVYLL